MQDILSRIGVNINVGFYLVFLTLIWVRILMMASMLPFLFGRPVPRYVLVAASFLMAVFTFTNIAPGQATELPSQILTLVMLYVKEIFYGFAMGMAVSIIFHAFSAVGQMIDNQRGVAIARVLIPQIGEQSAISGLLLFNMGIVIYLAVGGHRVFLDTFFQSFRDLPVLDFPMAGPGMFALADMFMRITGEVLYISLQMSMPILIAIFLADLILGIANRMAPQIDVWMLGFTTKGYLGTLILLISITMMGDQMMYYAQKTNSYAKQTALMLQGKVPEGAPEAPSPEDGTKKPETGPPDVKTK